MLYPLGAAERAMKVHEIIMRALDGQLTWIQAAEILGRSPRSIRRLRRKLQRDGYDGLFDRRRQVPSPKRPRGRRPTSAGALPRSLPRLQRPRLPLLRPPPALCPLLLRLRMPNSGTAGKASWPS